MSVDFRAQPAVKSIFVYRNGDAHTEARRVLLHEKRVRDFETLLREVTGRVRAPFGAVRCIYTPRAGHRVDALENVRHGEQYVAAGKERFQKLDYLQIGRRKKQMLENNGQVRAAPQNRIIVSARFLKPIKEPCAIFVVANGDVLNPAVRFLVPSRLLGQFERILEMITEKMGLRILGGVRSLCSLEGVPVTDGKDLENGQFYVAVGRDRFKCLPYADSLFKPVGMRRIVRSKAGSLPPIYKYTSQNGDASYNSSTAVNGASKSNHSDVDKRIEHATSLVRQISQARLMAIRKKRSNLINSYSTQDNDDADPKPEAEDVERKEKPAGDENSSVEQVNGGEDKASGEEVAAAEKEEEEEAAAGAAEEAAVGKEEESAVSEEEAAAGEEEEAAVGDEEEAAVGEEEEAAGEKEEAAAGEKEEAAAGEEEEAAAGEEEEAAAGEEEEEPEVEAVAELEAAVENEAAGEDKAEEPEESSGETGNSEGAGDDTGAAGGEEES